MSGYELRWKRSALKELRKLPKQAVIKLVALAEALINEPYPSGCRKLSGTEHTYRVRSGDTTPALRDTTPALRIKPQ